MNEPWSWLSNVHVVGIVGLLAVFVLGTVRSINLGALGLVMTFLVGTAVVGESVNDMYGGFPVKLFMILTGVTYLFAIAANNGTVEAIVNGSARLARGRRAMIPWMIFVVASLPAMAGALGSAGVAMLAPIALRLAERCGIDRRMIGLMVVHGASAGNFSPLNPLGAVVLDAVDAAGLRMSATALFLGNLAYNVVLAGVIFLVFGGMKLFRKQEEGPDAERAQPAQQNEADKPQSRQTKDAEGGSNANSRISRGGSAIEQACTIAALIAVAVAAIGFDLNIGFLAMSAAVLLQIAFPKSSKGAEKKVAWGVVLLVCGIVTYVAALERYGTVKVIGDEIAALQMPLLSALLICAVAAVTSAFASSAGILGAMIPLAAPFMASGDVGVTGLVVALAVSATVVDATPFSTVGALTVANANPDERAHVFRGLLLWGVVMIATAPVVTWLIFILPS